MIEITELKRNAAYAVATPSPLTHEEVERLATDFKAAEAKVVFLDSGMLFTELDPVKVYAFQPPVELKPWQVEGFRKGLAESVGIKGVFLSPDIKFGELTFTSYNELTEKYAIYPDKGKAISYPTLGAVGESGELKEKIEKLDATMKHVVEKVKKLWRDHSVTNHREYLVRSAQLTEEEFEPIFVIREGALKELGDILWYVAAIAREFGTTLDEVARINIEKLTSRKERGTIGGSGDNR